MSQIKS